MNKLDLFKGKKVLVTGDTGFKGSWLALWLSELGAEVLGYALPPLHDEDHYNVIGLSDIITHVDGDIRDLENFKKVAFDFKPEFLFHLAAQPLVRFSYKDPKLTFDTNVLGSVNILETARELSSLRSVIYVTSDKCYKNKEWYWGYRENEELGGHDPYSASKACAEIVFASYLDSFFSKASDIGIASVRAGNVIGGGDFSEDRLIPDCVRSLMNKESIVIRSPGATRPWQHVLEPLSGYLELAVNLYNESKKFSSSWNFGPTDKSIWNVEKVVGRILEYWGSGSMKVEADDSSMHEAGFLHLSCDKAHYLMNWYPKWDIEESIAKTITWYKELEKGEDMLLVSKEQIKGYMEGESD